MQVSEPIGPLTLENPTRAACAMVHYPGVSRSLSHLLLALTLVMLPQLGEYISTISQLPHLPSSSPLYLSMGCDLRQDAYGCVGRGVLEHLHRCQDYSSSAPRLEPRTQLQHSLSQPATLRRACLLEVLHRTVWRLLLQDRDRTRHL